jgi:hypothetical protein
MMIRYVMTLECQPDGVSSLNIIVLLMDKVYFLSFECEHRGFFLRGFL